MFSQNTPQQTCRENLNIIYNHHTPNGGLGDINAGYCHAFSNFILSMSNPQFIQNIREFKKTFYYSQMQNLLGNNCFDTYNNGQTYLLLSTLINSTAPQLHQLLFCLYGDYLNTPYQYSSINHRNNVMQVLKFIKLICDGTDKDGKITNPDLLSQGLQQFTKDNGGNSRYSDNYNYMMAFFSHCALIMGGGDFGKVPYRTVYNSCGKQLEKLQEQQLGDIYSSLNNGDSFLSVAGGNHLYVCYKDDKGKNGKKKKKYYAIGSQQGPFKNKEEALMAWETADDKATGAVGERIIISNKLLTNCTKLPNTVDKIALLIELLNPFQNAFHENGDKDAHENIMKNDHMWRGIPSLKWDILNNIYSAMSALAEKRAFVDNLDTFDRSFIQNVNDICYHGINAEFIKNTINNLPQNNMVMKNPMGMNNMGMNPQFMLPNNMKNQIGMNNGNLIPQSIQNNPLMMQKMNDILNSVGQNNNVREYNPECNSVKNHPYTSNQDVVDCGPQPVTSNMNTMVMNNNPEYLFGLKCLGEKPQEISECCAKLYWPSCC